MGTPERLEANPLQHNLKRVAEDIAGWPKSPRGRSSVPDRAALEANKKHFGVARLFEHAESRLRTELPNLTRCTYPIGVWHVIGECHRRHTNYVGVDVAREFPGAICVLVFVTAVDLIGDDTIMDLRSKHEWQRGDAYYPDAKDDRHRIHTNFLIPSIDYWERHQQDFINLAADINAAI